MTKRWPAPCHNVRTKLIIKTNSGIKEKISDNGWAIHLKKEIQCTKERSISSQGVHVLRTPSLLSPSTPSTQQASSC